jgi:hypothetical protein
LARTSSRRGFAALLAALCVLGPILAQAHLVLVQHARCAEHGELLHLGATAPSESAVSSDSATGSGVSAPRTDPSESHEHDHCVIASGRKTQAPAGSTAPLLSLSPPVRTVSPNVAGQLAPLLPLYILAPKNSPPA